MKIPLGWKLVPIEPTAAMLKAGEDEPISHGWSKRGEMNCDPGATYRAMLDAAPVPEKETT